MSQAATSMATALSSDMLEACQRASATFPAPIFLHSDYLHSLTSPCIADRISRFNVSYDSKNGRATCHAATEASHSIMLALLFMVEPTPQWRATPESTSGEKIIELLCLGRVIAFHSSLL